MNEAIISACNVCKAYQGRQVIKNISIDIKKGEFVSIIGESGAGKSTLLYILSGIERPDSGAVYLNGSDIFSLNDALMSKLRLNLFGFVFQFDNLLPNLTVFENLLLPITIAKAVTSQKRQEAEELLSYFNIDEIKDKRPSEISGGEQQRASIARALIINPQILFLDEPTGSLDSASAEQVMSLLKRINEEKGVTIVQVTHSAKYAAAAKRIIEVKDGVLIDA